MQCDRCGHEMQIGEFPFCPHDRQANSVIGDDIPGGIDIRHGICNPDGTPKRYYSKSSMAKAAAERGLANYVVHVPMKGSDKSPHTTRWV